MARAGSSAHLAAAYATDRMHPGVFGLAIGSYGAMVLALWLLFVTDVQTVLSLLICTAYFGMYFGVPVAMYRIARKSGRREPPAGSLGRFLRGDLETIAGNLSGWSALGQVLVIPVSLTLGLIAMGVILKMTA
ncbi:MAG: hypothetical protein ACWA6X_11345 [Bauldia sp.]|jgi:hypothetical protein